MIRRPPRSTLDRSSAASDVYKRQAQGGIAAVLDDEDTIDSHVADTLRAGAGLCHEDMVLSLIHISEPTRPY